jgi:hexosaminidase
MGDVRLAAGLWLLLGVPASAAPSLMPLPASLEARPGAFRLGVSFAAAVAGDPGPRLSPACVRALRRLAGRTGIFFTKDFTSPDRAGLLIRVRRPGRLVLGEDESYSLEVSSGRVELSSESDLGALRGLETLLQLLAADGEGYFFPALRIDDAPRFPWRGLLIDASRHFMPVEVLERNVDAMAAVKLNVLHLHLSDDQGFRVESRAFPRLNSSERYSREQVRGLVAYADERGIRVVPEFDVPGHCSAILAAYPELGSSTGPYHVQEGWGIFDPALDPSKRSVYKFLDRLFAEMAELFPDEFFHIGGDENNGREWDASAGIARFKAKKGLADNRALQAYFNSKALAILEGLGKKMVGWDEILVPGIAKDIVIQAWRGREFLAEAAGLGYRGILSKGYYIDLIHSAGEHYLNDPLPADSPLDGEARKRVLGGEATMWAEMVDKDTVDSRIWPRTAAIAERLWSPPSAADVPDMYRRLETLSLQLEELGLAHLKNPEMMLRRLAGGGDPSALRVLAGLIEPVKDYSRQDQGVLYTTRSPLTRMVDAAGPDAPAAREFGRLVDDYLAGRGPEDLERLRGSLALWKGNYARMADLAARSPVLREVEPLSASLSALAVVAGESLDLISGGKPPQKPWSEACARLIQEARKPRGQAELMIVGAVEKLVAAAEALR